MSAGLHAYASPLLAPDSLGFMIVKAITADFRRLAKGGAGSMTGDRR